MIHTRDAYFLLGPWDGERDLMTEFPEPIVWMESPVFGRRLTHVYRLLSITTSYVVYVYDSMHCSSDESLEAHANEA